MMKTTEVTHGEWHFLMGSPTSSYNKACGDDCPVGRVSWRQSMEYLNALSEKEGLETCYNLEEEMAVWKGLDCKGYRLPTEAEWEYAARGGTKTPRYGEIDETAWYYENSESSAHPVGKKTPNAYGLYDMLGNHNEWTWDLYVYGFYEGKMTDPISGGLKQESNDDRIVRGGCHRDNWISIRSAYRGRTSAYPNGGDDENGFRPVRTVTTK